MPSVEGRGEPFVRLTCGFRVVAVALEKRVDGFELGVPRALRVTTRRRERAEVSVRDDVFPVMSHGVTHQAEDV